METKIVHTRQCQGTRFGRRLLLRNYIMALQADGIDEHIKKINSCRSLLIMIMTTGGFDYERTPFHFQDILHDCIEDLLCAYNNPFRRELSDVLLDITLEVEDRVGSLKAGDIYIPSSYFHFIGEFRSIFGLFGFGGVMDDHHVAASTEWVPWYEC